MRDTLEEIDNDIKAFCCVIGLEARTAIAPDDIAIRNKLAENVVDGISVQRTLCMGTQFRSE